MEGNGLIRVERLRGLMRESRIDALICRLPENVVYITDYWPHHGFSFVVLPVEGKPLLFVPEVEEPYAQNGWSEVTTFGWGLLKDGDLYDNYRRLLKETLARLDLSAATVGVEKSFEIVGPTYRAAEPVVPSGPWVGLLDELLAGAAQVDAADVLLPSRAVKTPYEIQKLRVANEIAERALNAVLPAIEPGMTEAEIGARVEYEIRAHGPGYKGALLARAEAEVAVGPTDTEKGTLLIPSTARAANKGDLVMVELATVVDGYWSDLTYMAVVGEPDARQREVHNAVLAAQQAAAQQMKAGMPFSAPDAEAHRVLKEAGLDEYFVHITGHGVGLRYHEFIPVLVAGATGILEAGMVSSVEPGVYIPGFGGIRIEDNVAVGEDGPVFLSTPRKPW